VPTARLLYMTLVLCRHLSVGLCVKVCMCNLKISHGSASKLNLNSINLDSYFQYRQHAVKYPRQYVISSFVVGVIHDDTAPSMGTFTTVQHN